MNNAVNVMINAAILMIFSISVLRCGIIPLKGRLPFRVAFSFSFLGLVSAVLLQSPTELPLLQVLFFLSPSDSSFLLGMSLLYTFKRVLSRNFFHLHKKKGPRLFGGLFSLPFFYCVHYSTALNARAVSMYDSFYSPGLVAYRHIRLAVDICSPGFNLMVVS